MGRPGRPEKTRNVFAFEDELLLPEAAVVDTSFVAAALLSAQPHHEEARHFFARLADSGPCSTSIGCSSWNSRNSRSEERSPSGTAGGGVRDTTCVFVGEPAD